MKRIPMGAWLSLAIIVLTATDTHAGSSRSPPQSKDGVAWVYHKGSFAWEGDWSYALTADYRDASGAPIDGRHDLKLTATGAWGGWQPYFSAGCQRAASLCFDTSAYRYLVFAMKPTRANQRLKAAILSSGDTADGIGLYDLSSYCSGGSNPPIGQWESCKVPLSAFGLTDPVILKFSIGDQTGSSTNVWYLDDVGFSAD